MNGQHEDNKKKSDAQKEAEDASRSAKDKEQNQQQSSTQQPKQQDKSRPVSSTPISGTPWYIFLSCNYSDYFLCGKSNFCLILKVCCLDWRWPCVFL